MLASLVKNGRSVELMRNVIKCQGIPPLVAMVSSEHLVMQNEALVALTLICSTVLGSMGLLDRLNVSLKYIAIYRDLYLLHKETILITIPKAWALSLACFILMSIRLKL